MELALYIGGYLLIGMIVAGGILKDENDPEPPLFIGAALIMLAYPLFIFIAPYFVGRWLYRKVERLYYKAAKWYTLIVNIIPFDAIENKLKKSGQR